MLVAPTAALLLLVAAGAKDLSGIKWLEDDWDGARQKALREGKLVAVDAWAAWCHTCIAMQGDVFTQPEMAELRDAHVWLKLDFDNPKNAKFFERHSANIIPTFYLVDPKREDVVRRWSGAGTVQDMLRFFAKQVQTGPLAQAELAMARNDYAGAARIYSRALDTTADRATRTRLLSGYTEALWKTDPKACAREGAKHLAKLDNTVPGVDAISRVASCASQLEDEAEQRRILERVRDRMEQFASADLLALSPDDRSSYYSTLVGVYDLLGQSTDADEAVEKQVAVLEEAARAAATETQRSTYTFFRMECYLRLGRYADAEKMLLASNDVHYTFWLAFVYARQGKVEQGLRTIDRAIAMGYGGRLLRSYSTKIDLLVQKGDLKAARKVEKIARAHLKKVPPQQVLPSWLEEFEARVSELKAASRRRK